jgi:predicted nucleic-acid-binding Zn-ribbon protein
MRAALDPSIAPQVIMDFGAGSTKVFVVEKLNRFLFQSCLRCMY